MPQKAALIIGSDNNNDGVEIQRVDIADFNFPIFDELVIPTMVPTCAQFEHEHTQKWSDAIRSFAGYILITPEYDGGVPGALKNAID